MAPEMNCTQCLNPDAKGLHTCGRDQPKRQVSLRRLEDFAIRAFKHGGYEAGRFRDGTPFSTAPKRCQEVVNALISYIAEEYIGRDGIEAEKKLTEETQAALSDFRADLAKLKDRGLSYEDWNREMNKLMRKYTGKG
jgi:hypothetical protein